jgi:hypothetical protein
LTSPRELAALRLEDRLLAGLAYVILELRGEVVHLLDPRRMDAAVLDRLRRRPRNLAAKAVEGQRTTAWGVSSMMKSTPVRCSSADVAASRPMIRPSCRRTELNDGHGGLGGVARRHRWRVGDQGTGAAA